MLGMEILFCRGGFVVLLLPTSRVAISGLRLMLFWLLDNSWLHERLGRKNGLVKWSVISAAC